MPPEWVGSCPTGKVVDGGRAILDKLDRGVVLLDRHGAVVDANSLAMTRLLPGIAVRVKRATAAAYRLLDSPLPEPTDTRNAAFVALVYAPNGRPEISRDVLKDPYDLARAQADVASRLYEGLSVEETASALGLSLNTVRSHLKQIFTKCEVQSQAELMHLLALGPNTF